MSTNREVRNFEDAPEHVKEFYQKNHERQTYEFVLAKKQRWIQPLRKAKMTIWKAIDFMNTFVDESDPDIDFSQIEHALQSAEAARANHEPQWLILTAFLHDLGKMLCLWNEPQWCVVGDTFPVGCAFDKNAIIFPDYFDKNPDSKHPVYSTRLGVYWERCGLENIHLSFGHDEYLYWVLREYLPKEGLWMIRYHSAYPIHDRGEYEYLLIDSDREILEWARRFNQYDLYSKTQEHPDVKGLMPYYQDLVAKFIPADLALQW